MEKERHMCILKDKDASISEFNGPIGTYVWVLNERNRKNLLEGDETYGKHHNE